MTKRVSGRLIQGAQRLCQIQGPETTRHDDDNDIIGVAYIFDSGAIDITGEEAFKKYIVRLRQKHLIENRPENPDLYCCDYTRADALTRRGVLGERKWSGSHLCSECLGGDMYL